MVKFEVKKVVAVCFLDAVKLVLDQLSRRRMEMSSQPTSDSKDLISVYGSARRLRDYLQRCLSVYSDPIEIDIDGSDQGLLVACGRRAVEALDWRLDGGELSERDKEWLRRKRLVLMDWSVHLATKPLQDLPLPSLVPVANGCARDLNVRINSKLFGADSGSVFHGNDVGQLGGHTGPEPSGSIGVDHDLKAEGDGAAPKESEKAVDGSRLLGMEADEPVAPFRDRQDTLVDSRQIRDPRLRSLMVLDLRAFERAVAAKDHRLGAVHLSSVLEGAVIDYAIPRRNDLGMMGPPDSWNAQDILLRVMGDACAPKDRSLAYQLFAARNLIRPTAQLVSPTVVTSSSLAALEDFVQRALKEMGFQASCGEDGRVAMPELHSD